MWYCYAMFLLNNIACIQIISVWDKTFVEKYELRDSLLSWGFIIFHLTDSLLLDI